MEQKGRPDFKAAASKSGLFLSFIFLLLFVLFSKSKHTKVSCIILNCNIGIYSRQYSKVKKGSNEKN